jgi:glycosyltransferase involved in cell wall biosynthesis
MISGATKVVVSSPVLVSWCREAGIAATMITTPVDSPVIRRKKDYRRSGPLTIGWIGSSYTTPYLKLILPALKALRPRMDLRLLLIGADPGFDSEGIPVTLYPWNQANERSLLCQMDVGVMPLPDAPWAEGKGGYKIFLYMAAALPVIASPVGINRDIVDHGKNGYLAGNQAEWEKSFWLLGNDPLLCQKMGAEGSRLVQSRYDRQQCFVELSRCFDSCLDAEK